MLHLYDFVELNGPQKILTFASGPLLKQLSSPAAGWPYHRLMKVDPIGVARGGAKGALSPQFLENIAILCFERRFSKQNSVIRLKSSILPPTPILGWLRHLTLPQACRLTLPQACRLTLPQACRLTLPQACRLTLPQAPKKQTDLGALMFMPALWCCNQPTECSASYIPQQWCPSCGSIGTWYQIAKLQYVCWLWLDSLGQWSPTEEWEGEDESLSRGRHTNLQQLYLMVQTVTSFQLLKNNKHHSVLLGCGKIAKCWPVRGYKKVGDNCHSGPSHIINWPRKAWGWIVAILTSPFDDPVVVRGVVGGASSESSQGALTMVKLHVTTKLMIFKISNFKRQGAPARLPPPSDAHGCDFKIWIH